MPKNKGKIKSKDPVAAAPEPLASILDRAIAVLRPYAVKVAIALAAALLVIVTVSVWRWWEARRNGQATLAFTAVLDKANAPIGPAEPMDKLLANNQPRYATQRARAEAALTEIASFEKKYGSTDAARQALLLKGALLYDLGRWDEAITAYDRFLAKERTGPLVLRAREGKAFALEGKALAQTDAAARQKGLETALQAYRDLQPRDKQPGRDLALYHQGRIAQMLGQKERAVALYRQALESLPDPKLQEQIQNRIAVLEPAPKK